MQKSRSASLPDTEVLQATLHYLMTRYSEKPNRGIAMAVLHHLEMLIGHPEFRSDETGYQVYRKLLKTWTNIVSGWSTEKVLASNAYSVGIH
jgi:hypothetical protein